MTLSDAFDALLDSEADFYGVDCNQFKLDDAIWEAVEDKADGYRSMLDVVLNRHLSDGIFFARALARVRIISHDDGFDDLYKLVDVTDGHCWLRFGTGRYWDDYPLFIFDYCPKLESQR